MARWLRLILTKTPLSDSCVFRRIQYSLVSRTSGDLIGIFIILAFSTACVRPGISTRVISQGAVIFLHSGSTHGGVSFFSLPSSGMCARSRGIRYRYQYVGRCTCIRAQGVKVPSEKDGERMEARHISKRNRGLCSNQWKGERIRISGSETGMEI